MYEITEAPHTRQHPNRKIFQDRRRERERADLERFDRRYARFRLYLLEGERARRRALAAIAERDTLRRHRRDLARRAVFVHGVSHGPLDDPMGPLPDETLSEFGARIDRETPRLTLADFKRPVAWWDDESGPALRLERPALESLKLRGLHFRGRR